MSDSLLFFIAPPAGGWIAGLCAAGWRPDSGVVRRRLAAAKCFMSIRLFRVRESEVNHDLTRIQVNMHIYTTLYSHWNHYLWFGSPDHHIY